MAVADGSSETYNQLQGPKSFRLLKLKAGLDTDRISCTLLTVRDYQDSPPFEALSYCWGDKTDRVAIDCNGGDLAVTANLHAALQCLRRNDQARLVWVDAICINQVVIAERNQQVSIMRQIYGAATKVNVWLGLAREGVADALRTIEFIARGICAAVYGTDDCSAWLARLRKEPSLRQIARDSTFMIDTANGDPVWRWVSEFYGRNWFKRIWVIQEIQASSNVELMCGDRSIDWMFVALGATWLNSGTRPQPHPLDIGHTSSALGRVDFMTSNDWSTMAKSPFVSLLNRVRVFHASDPRDKVFSMLQHPVVQIAADGDTSTSQRPSSANVNHLGIAADYSQEVYDVYREVALRSIRQDRSLEILSVRCGDPDQPSWVPRWDVDVHPLNHQMWSSLYRASSDIPPMVLRVPRTTIVLAGIEIGIVEQPTDVLTVNGSQGNILVAAHCASRKYAGDIIHMVSRIVTLDTWSEYDDGHSRLALPKRALDEAAAFDADSAAFFARTNDYAIRGTFLALESRACDTCHNWISDPRHLRSDIATFYHCDICMDHDFDVCSACYEQGARCLDASHKCMRRSPTGLWYTNENINLSEELYRRADSGDATRFAKVAWEACRGKQFFSTEDGSLGFGPRSQRPGDAGVERGDVVAVFFGGSVPFIMRPM